MYYPHIIHILTYISHIVVYTLVASPWLPDQSQSIPRHQGLRPRPGACSQHRRWATLGDRAGTVGSDGRVARRVESGENPGKNTKTPGICQQKWRCSLENIIKYHQFRPSLVFFWDRFRMIQMDFHGFPYMDDDGRVWWCPKVAMNG